LPQIVVGSFERHLFDLAIVALPLLRPLRLLRLVMLLKVVNREAGTSLHGRVVAYVVGGASLLAFVGALAVLDAERQAANANITDFPTAVWWALTTMTTVRPGRALAQDRAYESSRIGLEVR
jgi:voltage-gated potassium channel